MSELKGGFTLPGEAGYEALTLKMAEKWGADVIRDSDGTELSPEILDAGYGIYSTICIIRDHNEWAKQNLDKQQQSFLMTSPQIATENSMVIKLMENFYEEQFCINDTEESQAYWQVYDRTSEQEVSYSNWTYNQEQGTIEIAGITPFHTYTASFLAFRIWEEISMYNHVTNHWDKEHLMQIDPRHPEVRTFMKEWLTNWCETHPHTTVVRFTSMFYNFVWIWGSSEKNRSLFTDWGSYDFTVSPSALKEFEDKYGYALTAEDFVNKGKFQVTHMPATSHKRDWMDFINEFVVGFGKELVDITHAYGKKAYVFYDDSWVGIEPYGDRFQEFGFDGVIKCVFSGFEARLCAGVDVPVHELRFHPYLFPVGLGGAPTFADGGNPTEDAAKYWVSVRRALLRAPIQRIGLGGYLHLTEDFPDFQDYIEEISDEFRMMQTYHRCGRPYVVKPKVAVLHYWGRLRSWILSGHFHETYMHDLIHVNEALAGLPVEVDFIDFEDVKSGCLQAYDVVINAGKAGDAWSGGDAWKDADVVSRLNQWVYEGGTFIGIEDPSATSGFGTYFRMADVLGVDKDKGERVCHGKWSFAIKDAGDMLPEGYQIEKREDMYLTDGNASVYVAHGNTPDLTMHPFGKGMGVYLGAFKYTSANARMLLNLILTATGCGCDLYLTDNPETECAYYPAAKKLVVLNNSAKEQKTVVKTETGSISFELKPYGQACVNLA
ncbi:MAG: 1,3-beta-galactosyl-N-acetylhexosamine phosphorylase [Hespellia sp.]|nr:1,3-beta-galactosyl-N-acetylhexosamine phosphorylase [Hespellia sp.]